MSTTMQMITTEEDAISALVGMVYGDGYLRKPLGRSIILIISHAERQLGYLHYKCQLLKQIMGYEIRIRFFNNNGYPGVQIIARTHPYLQQIHPLLYPGGKKQFSRQCLEMLTPLGLALWYLDDGSLSYKKREGQIYGSELTLNTYCSLWEALLIVDYFAQRWNIRWTISQGKGLWRVRMGAQEGRKLIQLIEQYVPACMDYKLDIRMKSD